MATYAEHPLHPALTPYVAAAWSVRAGEAPETHRVLPDGCVDVVVRPGGQPVVVGPMRGPALEAMAPGEVVHGLRFHPGAAPALLGVAADELLDASVALAELWGSGDGDLQAAALRRVGALEADRVVAAAVGRLARRPGTEIGALSAQLGVSERHLRRRFHQAVGYGPKRLGRVLRLQRLLAEARRHPAAAAVELALAAGYSDQPHMARDVRELAGTTPGALLAERGRSVQDAPAGDGQTA
jgi:AraC-like DNA-binding protein